VTSEERVTPEGVKNVKENSTSNFSSNLFKISVILLCIISNLPLLWMLYASFKPAGEAFKLTTHFTLANYTELWKNFNFSTYFFNSVLISFLAAFLSTLFALSASYVFAKKDFPLKNILLGLFFASFAVPGLVFFIPQFLMVVKLKMYDTLWALFVPHLANVFGFFMLYQFVKKIPDDLIEAAYIDGATDFKIFSNIIIPLTFQASITVFLLNFTFHWANFLWQLVVLKPSSVWTTLPVAIAMTKGQYTTSWELITAASAMSIIPLFLLFILAQRFFIEGLTQGSIKG